jgi:protocatechuate 3,4-dioxygenase beta subunit
MIAGLLWLAGCSSLPTGGPAPTNAPAAQAASSSVTSTAAAEGTVTPSAESPTATAEATAIPPTTTLAEAAAPACASPAEFTPAETEGPYFKAGSPERANLIGDNTSGVKLTITGRVLSADCKPVAHALLDFWQADDKGAYDNSGYTFRGHLFSNADGSYQLVTVVPGLYPGRTEHIHVKVQAPGGPLLTSQLFFPGVSSNDSDAIFDPRLVMTVQSGEKEWTAQFNFVVMTH